MKITFTKNISSCIYRKEETMAVKDHEFGWSWPRYTELSEEEFNEFIKGEIFAIYGREVDINNIDFSGSRVLDPDRAYIFYETPKGQLMPVGVTPSRKALADAARAERKFGHLRPELEGI